MEGSSRERFARLPPEEQARYRLAGQQMARFAEAHAVPIIFGPPAWFGGEVRGATGCVVQLRSQFFVITASHVLKGYESLAQDDPTAVWQVGQYRFEPVSRIAWRDHKVDVVLLELSASEASSVGTSVASAPYGWPPPAPSKGHLVLISGYPKSLRQTDSPGRVGSGAISTLLEVGPAGDSYFYCEIQRGELISFNEEPVPPEDTDYGGWSGSPVFLVRNLAYPLVGIVSEFQGSLGLLRVAALAAIRFPT